MTILRQRITLVWILLILATALSWEFGHGLGFGDNIRYASTAVLLISFVKLRFVYMDFMELREAPLAMRLAFDGWSVAVCGILLALYWSAP